MNQGIIGWSNPVSPHGLPVPYVNVQDQKAQNTAGGTFTSGSFVTRVLNTLVSDTAGIATLASNQLRLPAGLYQTSISCPAFGAGRVQARLFNITTGLVVLTGASQIVTGTSSDIRSLVVGQFRLADASVFEVQHRCSVTQATNGLGVEANFGTEIYTIAEFWKLA